MNAIRSASESRWSDGTPIVSVDAFCRRKHIDRGSILHSDIQGAEAEMLRGAESMLAGQKIDSFFISTHSNALHDECVDLLSSYGYVILVSVDLRETYSADGIVVAKPEAIEVPECLTVSKKPQLAR